MQTTLEYIPVHIALRLWVLTATFIAATVALIALAEFGLSVFVVIAALVIALIGGLPAVFILTPAARKIESLTSSIEYKRSALHLTCAVIALLYGVAGVLIFSDMFNNMMYVAGVGAGVICLFSQLSILASRKMLNRYFSDSSPDVLVAGAAGTIAALNVEDRLYTAEFSSKEDTDQHASKSTDVRYGTTSGAKDSGMAQLSSTHTLTQHKMETHHMPSANLPDNSANQSSRYLIKGLITAGLILFMLIPVAFIMNLISEREERQKVVAAEVSERWATAQTLTGPYLHVPYNKSTTSTDGKVTTTEEFFTLLPENLSVGGTLDHEVRKRSIYNVLLYRAWVKSTGNFVFNLPENVKTDDIIWSDVRICAGVTDFKGIEERLSVNLNGNDIELSPGLPDTNISRTGLSAGAKLTAASVGQSILFASTINIRGSEKLHFIPLAGNSNFTLQSAWTNPSFDGNTLPHPRDVSDTGFTATWKFNKANVPFGTTISQQTAELDKLAFGVTMVQPADHYAKTERTAKYAILIIGLTFSLFFIVEIMQKKPVHPVQYVLVGMALVIFYTLLLSFSEFIVFDNAYAVAAAATIALITLYAKAHFRSWKSATLFGVVLFLLYTFIFILIRLEDTALLVGSIGLFIILALAMYASRKVNWYGTAPVA